MFDIALASAGAQVIFATSADENYPPENIIDGSDETFWVTTGLFPQEFIISFPALMNIKGINTHSSNVRKLSIERSVQNEPLDFEPVENKELESTDGQLQTDEMSVSNVTAQHLRFTILSGYDHFVSVHRVHIDGNAVHNS